jgi:hypothetical protein
MSPEVVKLSPAVIYPAQSMLTLISRAWNLLRTNLKSTLLLMAAPTVVFTVLHLMISVLSSQTVLTPASGAVLALDILLLIGCAVLAFPSYFFWVFSCCAISRLHYSAIVDDTPLTIRECWQYIRTIWGSLTLLIVILSIVAGGLVLVSLIVFYLGLILSVVAIAGLGVAATNFHHLLPGVMTLFFVLVWGFVVLTVMIGLVSFQGLVFIFPLLAVSTGDDPATTWWQHLKHAYALLFGNVLRVIPFTLILFLFSWVIISVLMSPAWIWSIIELTRLGINQQYHIPLYIQTVLNLWSSMANLLVIPFQISAMTLFWYDCLVRKEGLDLKLWFNRILRSQGKPPEAFPGLMHHRLVSGQSG